MFAVARSVFWLTVAYLVIKPGVDLPDANALSAQEISAQVMAAGSQAIAAHIDSIECADLTCIGGKAVAAHALASVAVPPPVATTIAVLPSIEAAEVRVAPIPRTRPHWAS